MTCCALTCLQLLEQAWLGHAAHCTTLLADADGMLLAAVHAAVAAFRLQASRLAATIAADYQAARARLLSLLPQWRAAAEQLQAADSDSGKRDAVMQQLQQDGRGWLQVLSAVVNVFVGDGVEATEVMCTAHGCLRSPAPHRRSCGC